MKHPSITGTLIETSGSCGIHDSRSGPRLRSRFYRTVLGATGIEPTHGQAEIVAWDDFAIMAADPQHAPTRNLHAAFAAASRAQVDAFWSAGVATRYVDAGEPGQRAKYAPYYYRAFLLDPDRNSAEAGHHRDCRRGGTSTTSPSGSGRPPHPRGSTGRSRGTPGCATGGAGTQCAPPRVPHPSDVPAGLFDWTQSERGRRTRSGQPSLPRWCCFLTCICITYVPTGMTFSGAGLSAVFDLRLALAKDRSSATLRNWWRRNLPQAAELHSLSVT